MKTSDYCKPPVLRRHMLVTFLVALLAFLPGMPAALYGQNARSVSGTVIDELGEPLIGASVTTPGVAGGVTTDIDGNFTIRVTAGVKQLTFSYVGYTTQTVDIPASGPLNVTLRPSSESLQEMVVIGYGTQKKNDLTGSVSAVSEKDFNKGVISSPEELINGKIAGVQITNNGGSPNSGSTIRVRGGASLNASNDPLIVLDGVPMEVGGGITGSGNFLSMINPNDIESMTVLKDASSTAIYGSRASNGVIIITTKKGGGKKVKVSFQTTNSLSHAARHTPMLSVDQFRSEVLATGNPDYINALGNENTNWNDAVFRTGFGTDNNISIGGRATSWLPYRVSLGAMYQEGILKRDNVARYTANINLTPSFFNDKLRVNLSGKGSYSHNRFTNSGAIWNALAYDPTQPVYGNFDENGQPMLNADGTPVMGGFHEIIDKNGHPGQGAIANPLGMIEAVDNTANVYRFIGNVDVDYRLHPLPELRFHVTGGLDWASGKSKYRLSKNSFKGYNDGGSVNEQGPQKNENRLLTVYANYNKEFEAINSTVDATIGYDYQYWKSSCPEYITYNEAGEYRSTTAAWDERHSLISYYGRLNYSYDSRYLLTATFRRDGSSRFAKDKRWGTFPSVAIAWRPAGESFWESIKPVMNDFKIRASYGVTGQQDGIANYSYIPNYTLSQPGAYYWFNGQWIQTARPDAYNSDLKWETTKSWNFGVDMAFLNNRFTASVDYYTRKTHDLLATVPVPAGINFAKEMLTNVGNVDSKGVEIALTGHIINTKDWQWDATFNATWLDNKITNLSLNPESVASDTYVGYAESTPVMVYKTGYAPHTFWVYKQIYDESGAPIEGLYADLNGDGTVDSNDRYYYHNAHPDWILGLSTSLRWKKWTLSTSLRAQLGNYLYNQMSANMGASECFSWCSGQVNNLSASYADTHFTKKRYESDYYVENASFLKMDNLQLNYDFGKVGPIDGLHVSAMVQNVFTITKYKGLDPENDWGIEGSAYPRPRTYSLTIGLNF